MGAVSRYRPWLLLFQKKRGEHRTISPTAAFWAELGIFALVLFAGILGVELLVSRIFLPHWRAVKDYQPQWGVIRQVRISEFRTDEGSVYRPEILVEYQVAGLTVTSWAYDPRTPLGNGYLPDRRAAERALQGFWPGTHCLVHINPQNPAEALAFRSLPWWIWLVVFVPVSLVILGVVGLVMVLQAGKERPLLAQVALFTQQPLRWADVDGNQLWPTVPRPLSPQESPGVRLPIRLPILPVELGSFLGWFLASLLWNGASLTVLTWAWTGLWLGKGDWLLVAFSCTLVAVGVVWLVAIARFVARQWRVGPTIVEISAQPLLPGGRYQVYVAQFGRIKVNRLSVSLVCEERVIFPEGTETRSESRQVQRMLLFRREAFEIRAGVPFEAFFDLELPTGVMHSFRSPHNQIVWMLVAENIALGLPAVRRCFPVVVYPQHSGKVGV